MHTLLPAASCSSLSCCAYSFFFLCADSAIRDINGLHKSLLHEYDYMVQDAWVSSGSNCSCCSASAWQHLLHEENRIALFSMVQLQLLQCQCVTQCVHFQDA
jgi:hypothetical protein